MYFYLKTVKLVRRNAILLFTQIIISNYLSEPKSIRNAYCVLKTQKNLLFQINCKINNCYLKKL